MTFLFRGFYWLSGHPVIIEKFQLGAIVDEVVPPGQTAENQHYLAMNGGSVK